MGSWNLHAALWRLLIKDSAVEVTPVLFLCLVMLAALGSVPLSSDAGDSGLLALTATELRDVGLALLLSGPNLPWIPSLKDKAGASCLPTHARLYAIDSQITVSSPWGIFFLLTFLPPWG